MQGPRSRRHARSATHRLLQHLLSPPRRAQVASRGGGVLRPQLRQPLVGVWPADRTRAGRTAVRGLVRVDAQLHLQGESRQAVCVDQAELRHSAAAAPAHHQKQQQQPISRTWCSSTSRRAAGSAVRRPAASSAAEPSAARPPAAWPLVASSSDAALHSPCSTLALVLLAHAALLHAAACCCCWSALLLGAWQSACSGELHLTGRSTICAARTCTHAVSSKHAHSETGPGTASSAATAGSAGTAPTPSPPLTSAGRMLRSQARSRAPRQCTCMTAAAACRRACHASSWLAGCSRMCCFCNSSCCGAWRQATRVCSHEATATQHGACSKIVAPQPTPGCAPGAAA